MGHSSLAEDEAYGDREIDIRSILGFLRRQLRLIVVTFVVLLVLAAVTVFSLTPKYTATSLVLVDPVEKNLLDPGANTTNSGSELARVESEAGILRSDATLLSVIRDQSLVSDPEFGVSLGLRDWLTGLLTISDVSLPTGQDALNEVLSNLRQAVSVDRRDQTYLIEVSVEARDPEKAADIANTIASTYIGNQVQTKIASALATRDILERRLEQARKTLSESELNVDEFVLDNVDRIVSETGMIELSDLRARIEETEAEREARLQRLNIVTQGIAERDWETLRETLESDAARALAGQREDLAARLSGAPPNSQQAVDLAAELKRVEEQLASTARIELSDLQKSVTEAESGIANLKGEIRTTALNSDLPADLLTTIYGLQQNAAVSRNQYQLLLSRLRDVEAQAEMQIPDSRVVSPAFPPNRPSFPNIRLILGISGFVGLALGIGLAYLRENYVGGFISEMQVQSVLHIPVVATIPRVKPAGENAGGGSPADHVIAAPVSIFTESVRRLRAGIDQALDRQPAASPARGAVIMVTSALPSEGKSSLALSLGRTYALSGKSAIVIDCDLRRPSIHRHLNFEPARGLTSYLSSDDETLRLGDVLVHDPKSSLAAIVGMREPNVAPDQLIVSARFDNLLEAARGNFQVVILDSPPIGPIVDGLYLAKRADVIVMAIQWAQTSQEDARKALAALRDAHHPGTEILAAINATEGGSSAYGGQYSGYFQESY